MISNPWGQEFYRVAIVCGVCLIFGLAFGHLAGWMLFGVTICLAWHLYQLRRYEVWIQKGDWLNPPDAGGVWGEAYSRFYRNWRRNRERKRKVMAVLTRFQESAAAMPDATVVLNEEGGLVWWNEASERLLGFKGPSDMGQRVDNLIRHPSFIRYFHRGKFKDRVEFPSPVDSTVMLSVQVVPYGNNQRLLVGRDITRLHRLEQTRRDFVSNVSHELKTPLTVLRGAIETMQDELVPEENPRWARTMELMSQQTSRMQSIVEDLLFLARLDEKKGTVKKKPVDVPQLLGMVMQEIETGECRKTGHKIQLDADPRLWLIGDELELRSTITNLVVNAIRYSPDRSRIYIRWWLGDDGQARLAVRDEGIGIPAMHIPRLTERFYRVDTSRSRHTGGTGLGLAIVKHVLDRHRAHLEVESVLEKGSTFTCVFSPERVMHAAEDSAKEPPATTT